MASRRDPMDPGRSRILIVEAEAANTRLLERMLETAGYKELRSVNDPREALAAFHSFQPDLIMLDLHMPHLDGIQLLERFHAAIPRGAYLPIVVLTADITTQAKIGALELGATDFLAKPLDLTEVALRVRNLLETRSVYLELDRSNQEAARQVQELQPFVSTATVQLIQQHSDLAVGTGELRTFALLFTDMRNFTGYADNLAPKVVFSMLAESLQLQVDCVLRHAGQIDKIYGDGLLAYFDGEEKAGRALRCALEIRELVSAVQAPAGAPLLPVGLGVHLGKVLFGVLGANERKDHTVVGDAVNICARVCGQAGPFQVIATEEVRSATCHLHGVHFRAIGPVLLKGKPAPIPLYEALAADEPASGNVSLKKAGACDNLRVSW